ncbi:hypothetical protein [Acidovorax delafieldii]|jgi:hypothetical protein|uniref:hypothetical protein n=1 Tax=Acidovorax delafieldii TaxID=47920 RepID=UPI003757DDFD
MFGNFFNTSNVDAFSALVVRELTNGLPPDQLNMTSKKAETARARIDGKIRTHAQQLINNHQLNIYQKAKLGSRLQDDLREAGFPGSFSEAFAYDVVRLIALISAQAKAK